MGQRVQSASGLDRVFSPRSVAVVGASPNGGVGHQVVRNLLASGFVGPILPVHRTAKDVLGRTAYPTVSSAPGPIDLVVVAVPSASVMDVARDCARAKVGGLVVLTAGFREVGAAGARLEEELSGFVRSHGMRMVGPNCLGIMNLDRATCLNATFAQGTADPGTTAIVSQSGALGLALLEQAHRIGLGVARFASMGNKADVSSNDLLLLWENDPGVRQVLLYLESFGNPRNFVPIARRLGRHKPLIAVKAGRTLQGARAAQSHTGAMAESDALVDALFEQCGVLRAATVAEQFDLALAFDRQPPPLGNRVAIVTNSGGPAILATDALPLSGLRLAELAPETLQRLRRVLPPEATAANPVDLLAAGGPEGYRTALAALERDPNVDALLVIYTPVEGEQDVIRALVEAARACRKTLLAVHFGQGPEGRSFRDLVSAGVPTYTFPENAVRALGAMARWQAVRSRDAGRVPAPVLSSPVRGSGWLAQQEALQVAKGLGAVPPFAIGSTAAELVAASARLRDPVVLKAEAPGLVHKSDVGAVQVGLTRAGLAAAYDAMARRVRQAGHHMSSGLVMEQADAGIDVIVGGLNDAHFGPVVTVGLGGIYTEVLKDVQLRLAPLSDTDATRMVRALRSWPILEGTRGQAGGDVPALERLLLTFARFLADHPEVLEFELNPVRLFPPGRGLAILDARLRAA